ncbi:unnamed protein product [Blepharisma stoltei]|uniref:Uncharacterized protein n=1 Tax=Blepharisma stoltei TaxID=1481888 RepID=A0AAU9IUB6_9CILI|nr:unnamed protein product [Blepharisma stoltei]
MNNHDMIWKVQTYINITHFWVMAINAVACTYYLCRNPSRYFNLRKPTHVQDPVPWFLFLGIAVLPLYYACETITTSFLCAFVMRSACMYTNHHVLTVNLFLVLFHYKFYNGPLLLTIGTHGLMNVGYYYNKFLQIFMCKWYMITSLLDLIYLSFTIYLFWSNKKIRWMGAQILTFLMLIILNNTLTPELVALCKKNEDEEDIESNTDWLEYSLNISLAALIVFLSWRFTKKEENSND